MTEVDDGLLLLHNMTKEMVLLSKEEQRVFEHCPTDLPEQLFDHPQRELTRKFIRQIHETTFLIESEHSDLYAMVAQMEQFCQRYNLTHKQIQRVMHVIDELLIIIGTAPGTRLTLSYTEQNEELGFAVSCPQPIDPAVLSKAENELSVSFLRHFSRDISIEGNTLRLLI